MSDPSEAAAVRAGWQLIEAYERLSRAAARRVFETELDAWHQYAEDTTEILEHRTSANASPVRETTNNLLRYRRTMDFARAGDRVFDVGFGSGYLAAQLVKYRNVESYHGVDVVAGYVPAARRLFEANGLSNASIELEIGDLYDLTREQVEATGATLVICCEVLEHVPDAEKALKTLADALPAGADLLFSVPMHGRLESTWGHVSVFDAARLKEMLDGAGLHAHHVEPLSNVWSLIVASSDPAPSERVRGASGRPPQRVNVALTRHRDYVYPLGKEHTGVGAIEIVPDAKDEQLIRCRLAADGGVSFAVQSLEALRLYFDFTAPENIKRIIATAYAADQPVAEWIWKPKPGAFEKRVRRFGLRPGEGEFFMPQPHEGAETADRVEVRAVLAADGTAEFGFKAAYLP
ncbi:MAG: class I SAM-dependent methyltransferase [Aeromicrobium sp.]